MPSNPFVDLESSPAFRRTMWKRTLFLGLALVINLAVLALVACLHVGTSEREGSVEFLGYHVWLAYDSWTSYVWLVIFLALQLWLGHRGFRELLKGEGMISLYPEDKSGGRKFGGLTGPALVKMVQDLALEMEVGTIDRVLISDSPDPNAYTARIFGLGTVVVLHTNLLEILPPGGVRAIVAHEVGHVRRKDSIVYMLTNIPRSFLTLLGAIILWKIGIGLVEFDGFSVFCQRLVFLYLVWRVATWVLGRLDRVANLASRQSEHLADLYAAKACSVEAMLNALLLVGERGEALTVLQQTLAKQPHLKGVSFTADQVMRILKRFPPRELDHHKARELAARLYIEEKLEELKDSLCVPFTEDQIVDLARRADVALRAQQAEEARQEKDEAKEKAMSDAEKEAAIEKLLINWRQYDRDRSGHLDLHEARAMVTELRGEPHKMIFRQFLGEDARWQSHLTMRARVMYLCEAFE